MSISRENNLLNDKIVYDLTKFTHLDYPDHLACILWFAGCKMRCSYCYNKDIVYAKSGKYTLNDIVGFLRTRVGLLDGVVLSGGEATEHDLNSFCREIKELGFLIKLDTSGINFNNLYNLCESNLIDYIALDYKAPEYKYKSVTGSNKFEEFSKSLDFLIKGEVGFEVRTTVHADLLNEDDINFIIKDLKKRGYSNDYFLQNFLETEKNIGNIEASKKKFDKTKIENDINIIYRN